MEVLERDCVRQRERDCEVGTCSCKAGGLAPVLSPRRFGAPLRQLVLNLMAPSAPCNTNLVRIP
jgi:hypothetical protein